ncbi:hypothetical protein ACIA8E_26450 [Streptomyces sp. NPDC051664]|uniref:hypothetical protein n=1 Tax=Streptomyces sp. NPDC051664 TaxID=3365668 RepID=UPI00379E29B3
MVRRHELADAQRQQILAESQIETDAADLDGQLAEAVEEETRQGAREWAVDIDVRISSRSSCIGRLSQ